MKIIDALKKIESFDFTRNNWLGSKVRIEYVLYAWGVAAVYSSCLGLFQNNLILTVLHIAVTVLLVRCSLAKKLVPSVLLGIVIVLLQILYFDSVFMQAVNLIAALVLLKSVYYKNLLPTALAVLVLTLPRVDYALQIPSLYCHVKEFAFDFSIGGFTEMLKSTGVSFSNIVGWLLFSLAIYVFVNVLLSKKQFKGDRFLTIAYALLLLLGGALVIYLGIKNVKGLWDLDSPIVRTVISTVLTAITLLSLGCFLLMVFINRSVEIRWGKFLIATYFVAHFAVLLLYWRNYSSRDFLGMPLVSRFALRILEYIEVALTKIAYEAYLFTIVVVLSSLAIMIIEKKQRPSPNNTSPTTNTDQ